jgi:hypothetical protein
MFAELHAAVKVYKPAYALLARCKYIQCNSGSVLRTAHAHAALQGLSLALSFILFIRSPFSTARPSRLSLVQMRTQSALCVCCAIHVVITHF